MTEGDRQHGKPMCVRIWLEVGHACEPRRSAGGRALSLDWRVWVRGARGDVSAFVHKVVFHLNPPSAFVYPKRVLQEPPYEIKESGCASIDIPIHVYLKFAGKPRKIRLRYSLHIESNDKTHSESKCVYYDFENPSEPLYSALMKGGGELIAKASDTRDSNNKLIVLFSDDDRTKIKPVKPKGYKFVEPIRCKHEPKRRPKKFTLEAICTKCGESIDADFKKQLRTLSMTEDEINRIAKLYISYTSYEKTGRLPLPPISDPIYTVPELPVSLRGALTSIESDYTMK
ncbi:protein ENL-like [Aricia agestis]|uniref:protein ENL-like n=1 Tax=Aricia agestis TaxID=91739 RepID=UPI001C203192|nr:protein ENL-like [Aricia agestis]XP_041980406.1 protein ENL-like [Aricia agestis]